MQATVNGSQIFVALSTVVVLLVGVGFSGHFGLTFAGLLVFAGVVPVMFSAAQRVLGAYTTYQSLAPNVTSTYELLDTQPSVREAEDAVLRRLHARLAHLGAKVEVRNQARVHLWYPDKHGLPYPPLARSTDGIDRFLTQNTQIGARRAGESFDVYAPHGFDDVARLIVRPNRAPNFSIANYEAKAARWKALWPELTVIGADA